jgi:hypothetical protein
MTRRWALALSAVAAVSLTACEPDNATNPGPEGQDDFARYAAIGTSLSMGVTNGDNAVVYFYQQHSWPALLARQAGNTGFSQPLMRSPGCYPPIIAPLALGRNLRGVSIATTDTTCAGLLPGLAAPTATSSFNNVALSGALTTYALNITPELAAQGGLGAEASNSSAVFRRKAYPLVLPPGKSQVTAVMMQDPSFVSIELGANEVLGGPTSGVIALGQNVVPPQFWQPEYDKVIDSIVTTGAKVLLVTVPRVSSIVGMRTGAELHADSANFRSRFRVTILSDCKDNPNLIFTPRLVPGTIAFAAANPGVPVVPISCTNNPAATVAQPDYVLTPEDVATLNAMVDAMNAHITSVAGENDWALLDANAVLAEIVAVKPTYSVVRQMTCVIPYGPYIGLDGVHPTSAGYVKVANAAIARVNDHYDFTIPTIAEDPPNYAALCP